MRNKALWLITALLLVFSAMFAACTPEEEAPPSPPAPPAAQVTVTFDSRGGSPVAAQTVTEGSAAEEPADPVRDGGWEFLHWSETVDGGAYDFSAKITADRTLYAVWRQYSSVTYVWYEGKTEAAKVYAGETLAEPEAPTREDHDFLYWSETENGTEAYAFGETLSENKTLYAVWKQFYTVRYLFADGFGTQFLAPRRVELGGYAEDVRTVANLQYATQAYYWYACDKKNPTYADLTERFDFSEPLTQSVTLYTYAGERTSWTFPEEAAYDAANPWGLETAAQPVTDAQASVEMTDGGMRYRVAENASLSHVIQLSSNHMGQVPFDAASMRYLHVRYKNFGADPVLRLFVWGNGAIGDPVAVLHAGNHAGLKCSMEAADDWEVFSVDLNGIAGKRLIYLRMEWIASAAAARDTNGTDVLIGAIWFAAEDGGTVYQPPKAQATVTFDSAGGSAVPAQTVTEGEAAAEPEAPERTGYDFLYWSESADGNAYDFSRKVTGNKTLYAVWKQYFTVSYLWADGSGTQFLPSRKVYAGDRAEDIRTAEGLQYATQAYYWYLSDKETPTPDQLTARFDFSKAPDADVRLFTMIGERTSWSFPEEATYDAANPWGMETEGAAVTEAQASLAMTADGLRFRVAADAAVSHVTQLQSNNMGQAAFDASSMRYLKLRYKNFGADTTLRLFVYGTTERGGALGSLHAGNHAGLQANMEAADDWAELTVDLNAVSGYLVFLRMEFLSGAGAARDDNGTDVLIDSIRFTA